jgi:hypothetical protein
MGTMADVGLRECQDTATDTGETTLPPAVARPCPFCGEQPHATPWHGGERSKLMISCPGGTGDGDCDVVPSVTGQDWLEALARWNTRKPPGGE